MTTPAEEAGDAALRKPGERSKALGAAIGALRKSQGMTRVALAQGMGISEATIDRVIAGTSTIPLEIVDRAASALGVPVEMILLLAGVIPVELSDEVRADGSLVAILAERLEVPLTRISPSIEDAIEGDQQLDATAKGQLQTMLRSFSRLAGK